jgi:hypothetical protein
MELLDSLANIHRENQIERAKLRGQLQRVILDHRIAKATRHIAEENLRTKHTHITLDQLNTQEQQRARPKSDVTLIWQKVQPRIHAETRKQEQLKAAELVCELLIAAHPDKEEIIKDAFELLRFEILEGEIRQ